MSNVYSTGFKKRAAANDKEDSEDEEEEEEEEDDFPAAKILSSLSSLNASKMEDAAPGTGNHKLLDWIPKKIVKEWISDGIRNLSMIFALTGGAVDKSSNAVE
jgi:hypothetical protein